MFPSYGVVDQLHRLAPPGAWEQEVPAASPPSQQPTGLNNQPADRVEGGLLPSSGQAPTDPGAPGTLRNLLDVLSPSLVLKS